MNIRFLFAHTPRRAMLSLALCASLLSFGNLAQAQLYFEDFNHPTSTGNLAVSTQNWYGYTGSNATDVSGTTSDSADTISIAGANSYPPYTGSPATYGALYSVNRTTANMLSAAVTTFTSGESFSLTSGNTITWNMGNVSTASTVRLLIQVGGNGAVNSGTWYASATTFSNTSTYASFGNFTSSTSGDVTKSLTFSTLASSWYSFTLTPDSSLALGTALGANLTDTTITGIGFYMANGSVNNSIRIDNLTVVPEPSSLALGLGAMGMLLTLARRRV